MSTAALAATGPAVAAPPTTAPSLSHLMEDGIYLLFLLRNGNAPHNAGEFNRRIDQFLAQFERNARNFGKPPEAVHLAKYAFCALMDEIVLSSDFPLRSEWELAPLQLRLFGEHLAGEAFFDKLESLRLNPAEQLEPLEVYYTCLLLGFQGKYLLEGQEKLSYLTQRLGQEIAQLRGDKASFAPSWRLPQRFQQYVRNELPLWLYFALLAVAAVLIFLVYHWLLEDRLEQDIGKPVPLAQAMMTVPGLPPETTLAAIQQQAG